MFDLDDQNEKISDVTHNGITLKLVRKDPFGHIYLESDVHAIPERYNGAYTTIEAATKDAIELSNKLTNNLETKQVYAKNFKKAL